MTAPLLEVRGLRKTFAGRAVLDGVDLTLMPGESLVIIGGSGAGKSVLLRTILGLEQADAGTVLWRGAPLGPANRTAFMDRFGMLFQGGALFDSLTVWQNVAFRLRRPLGERAARAAAIERLARVGLGPEVADLHPAALSGGMQKRVALARAIAAEPEIIFFDEPTTGLDPLRAARITALIAAVTRDSGASAITITHDMASARSMADRIAFLDHGRIAWSGRPADLDAAAGQVPALGAFVDPVAALAAEGGG